MRRLDDFRPSHGCIAALRGQTGIEKASKPKHKGEKRRTSWLALGEIWSCRWRRHALWIALVAQTVRKLMRGAPSGCGSRMAAADCQQRWFSLRITLSCSQGDLTLTT